MKPASVAPEPPLILPILPGCCRRLSGRLISLFARLRLLDPPDPPIPSPRSIPPPPPPEGVSQILRGPPWSKRPSLFLRSPLSCPPNRGEGYEGDKKFIPLRTSAGEKMAKEWEGEQIRYPASPFRRIAAVATHSCNCSISWWMTSVGTLTCFMSICPVTLSSRITWGFFASSTNSLNALKCWRWECELKKDTHPSSSR